MLKLRETIGQVAPEVAESISYDMPTFKIKGEGLVYFSGWKNHVGFYSIPEGNEAFRRGLTPYAGEKGSLRFQLERPIPHMIL